MIRIDVSKWQSCCFKRIRPTRPKCISEARRWQGRRPLSQIGGHKTLNVFFLDDDRWNSFGRVLTFFNLLSRSAKEAEKLIILKFVISSSNFSSFSITCRYKYLVLTWITCTTVYVWHHLSKQLNDVFTK